VHVPFGTVRFSDKKLSTRKGDVIFLDELLSQAVAKTLEIINEKSPELENKDDVAKKVGIGAIMFTYLKNHRERDIVFNWEEMLSFDGETGPYVQYTYARAKSILRKVEEKSNSNDGNLVIDYKTLDSKEEFELVKQLEGFQSSIMYAIEKLEPSVVTRYVIEVAKSFNKFYNQINIANLEDEAVKRVKIKMVEATCIVIKNALGLIGIEVVDRM
jgi:arginyl-tRNA synthetase